MSCDLGEIFNTNISWCLFVHLNSVNKILCTLIESLVVVWVHSLLCWSQFDLSLSVRWQWWEINFLDFSVTLSMLSLLRWLCHFIRVCIVHCSYISICLQLCHFQKEIKENFDLHTLYKLLFFCGFWYYLTFHIHISAGKLCRILLSHYSGTFFLRTDLTAVKTSRWTALQSCIDFAIKYYFCYFNLTV